MKARLRIALIGCGRVGIAIGFGLKRAGHRIVSVRDTNQSAERRARRLLLPRSAGPRPLTSDPHSSTPDLLLIATPDSQIARAYHALKPALIPGQTVVHFSGALTSRVFGNASQRRVAALSMHPVMTFAGRKPVNSFNGVYFTLEGKPKAVALGRQLVKSLGGRALLIRAADKPLFHAACVFVSNLLDVAIDAGVESCLRLGIKPRNAFDVLEPLIRQTLSNIHDLGTAQALTGPIERGDIATIRRHVAALRRRSPELLPLYAALSQGALRLARRKDSVSPAELRALRTAVSLPE